MASISNAQLVITRDRPKKLSKVKVTCNVHFSQLELCMMTACPDGRLFRLRCSLWGEDILFDDNLFTMANVNFYPDATPSALESAIFEVTLGDGVLNEDFGRDEIYGKLVLTNISSNTSVVKKTNTVSGWF